MATPPFLKINILYIINTNLFFVSVSIEEEYLGDTFNYTFSSFIFQAFLIFYFAFCNFQLGRLPGQGAQPGFSWSVQNSAEF